MKRLQTITARLMHRAISLVRGAASVRRSSSCPSRTASHSGRRSPSLFSLSLVSTLAALFTASCTIEPPLHLVDPDQPIDIKFGNIILDLHVLWEYDVPYEWENEWYYGWDRVDDDIFGQWALQYPSAYHIRRYFTGEDRLGPHPVAAHEWTDSTRFRAKYRLGYYDFLVWNDVNTIDGVQSLNLDEASTTEYVTAYTNQSTNRTNAPHHAPAYDKPYTPGLAFYQPEFLFAGDYQDLHVTDNPADYDSLDVKTNTWYKFLPVELSPLTYIYLPQIILHHNRGRIDNVEGHGNLTGFARSVNMLTHITSTQDISVLHSLRMKRHLDYEGEDVDIIGGRAFTFGLTGVNPYRITRANEMYSQLMESRIKNYIELKMIFNNGYDSTMVFDVTEQVKRRYKGGVLTIHLDVDTVHIPSRSGGSGFDAVVKDYEEVVIPDIEL